MDATLLRLGYVVLAILTGIFPAVIGYIIAALIVPEKPKPHVYDMPETEYTDKKEEPKTETPAEAK